MAQFIGGGGGTTRDKRSPAALAEFARTTARQLPTDAETVDYSSGEEDHTDTGTLQARKRARGLVDATLGAISSIVAKKPGMKEAQIGRRPIMGEDKRDGIVVQGHGSWGADIIDSLRRLLPWAAVRAEQREGENYHDTRVGGITRGNRLHVTIDSEKLIAEDIEASKYKRNFCLGIVALILFFVLAFWLLKRLLPYLV